MSLTPNDLAAIGGFLFALALVITRFAEPEWWRAVEGKIRSAWSGSVGAWFTRRRMTLRVDRAPSDACRRDLNCGSWT